MPAEEQGVPAEERRTVWHMSQFFGDHGPTVLTLGAVTLAAVVVHPIVIWLLCRFQVGDTPDRHSVHDTWTPRGAGIGLLVVAAGAVLILDVWALRWVAALALPLGTVGFIDDVRELSPWTRLALQVVVALGFLGIVVGANAAPLWLIGVSFLWIVGFVNSFNFMDGINGMSGVNTAAIAVVWAVLAAVHDAPGILVMSIVLLGLALGFLPFNFPTARVFLGDSGSYLLGSWIAAGAVLVGIRFGIIAALLPMSLYVADTSWTIWQRVRHGEHAFKRDRDYVFHRLVTQCGLRHGQVTLLVGAGTLILGMMSWWMSVTASHVVTVTGVVLAISVVAVYLRLPRLLAGGPGGRVHAAGGQAPGIPRDGVDAHLNA